MRRKIIILLTCLVLFSCYSSTVFASGVGERGTLEPKATMSVIVPYFTNLGRINGAARASGNCVNVSVTVSSEKAVNIKIKMQIQKKSKSGWNTVKTWDKIHYCNKRVCVNESYVGKRGGTYRMKYTVTSGTESASGTTASVKL